MNERTLKLIDEKLTELHTSLVGKPLQILDIFNNFFGEDRVDMQVNYLHDPDGFKERIMTTPIDLHVDLDRVLGEQDYAKYEGCPITSLPDDVVEKILSESSLDIMRNKIGVYLFNNIFILVHFPHVRITNEHDKYIDISHLWARMVIDYNGLLIGTFGLNRSEYSITHLNSNYMHSHVSGIPMSNFSTFKIPCLGSGPIRNTISSLNDNYDEDIWNMFCLELSKYVSVESVAGVPYNYLERVGTDDMYNDKFITYFAPGSYGNTIKHTKFQEFVRHFINLKKLKFNYVNCSYSIGMSFTEYIILISNEFIKWYNDQFNRGHLTNSFWGLISDGILCRCIISNGKIYQDKTTDSMQRYSQYIGKRVCTFKGEEITLNITESEDVNERNTSVILNIQTSLYILMIILRTLNYRYGRDKMRQGDTYDKKVWYL